MNEDEMLAGSVTTGTEHGDVVVEDAERLRDANLQRVAEGMSRWCAPQSPHLDAIEAALEHAKAKHPKFADMAVSYLDFRNAVDQLAIARGHLADKVKANRCGGMTVLMCEVYEAIEAFSRKDYAATLDELAQCGAVVVRMMEAVKELMEGQEKAAKAGNGEE